MNVVEALNLTSPLGQHDDGTDGDARCVERPEVLALLHLILPVEPEGGLHLQLGVDGLVDVLQFAVYDTDGQPHADAHLGRDIAAAVASVVHAESECWRGERGVPYSAGIQSLRGVHLVVGQRACVDYVALAVAHLLHVAANVDVHTTARVQVAVVIVERLTDG